MQRKPAVSNYLNGRAAPGWVHPTSVIAGQPFTGFALPTSNTTYTPNQFFDVCLPHCSRGAVRLVAYLIRKTLGWCDEHGNPQAERHAVSWSDFQTAGISREMIAGAIAEAIEGNFIRCVRSPIVQKSGQPAIRGLYELRWDERSEYLKDPNKFRGFFSGDGNRTYIPNQFFDHVIPAEPLAVVKVVGSVIRFSIGYQNKWGHRKTNVTLSFQHIQNYALIRDRKTLSSAVQQAMKANYIQRVEEGYFDPDAGKLSRAAVYAVKWLNPAADLSNGQKTPPALASSKSRSENPTGNGQKSLPDQRSENPTDIEIKQVNKTYKQQAPITGNGNDRFAGEAAATFRKLKSIGFDDRAARAIAIGYSLDRVQRQIEWIDARKAKTNRLGMLRRAIQEDWLPPTPGKLGAPNPTRASGESFDQALSEARRRMLNRH